MPDPEEKYNYLFVSDFHISLGVDSNTGMYSPREDFFFDNEFFRFLKWAQSNRVDHKPWELVFVGDCFDFLPVDIFRGRVIREMKRMHAQALFSDSAGRSVIMQQARQADIPDQLKGEILEPLERFSGARPEVEQRPLDLKELGNWVGQARVAIDHELELGKYYLELLSEDSGIEKLDRIHEGHARFFEALAWWVACGNRLVMMVGNHDLELRWPGVQNRFKQLLVDKYFEKHVSSEEWGGAVEDLGGQVEGHYESFVDFRYYWFYYKPGVFYAQHGSQYETVCATVDLINPTWEKDGKVYLYPPFGNIGDPIVSGMEDISPQWENVGSHGNSLSYKFKEHPFRVTRLMITNMWRYSRLLMSLLIGNWGKRGPKGEDFKDYQELPGHEALPMSFIQKLYFSWDKPLLIKGNGVLAFFLAILMALGTALGIVLNLVLEFIRLLLSPRGGLPIIILLLLGIVLFPESFQALTDWIEGLARAIVVTPGEPNQLQETLKNLESIIQVLGRAGAVVLTAVLLKVLLSGIKEPIIGRLKKRNEKFIQLLFFGDKYIQEAGRQTYMLFKDLIGAQDDAGKPALPRFFIFGHDHEPFKYKLNADESTPNEQDVFYLNAGSWMPKFADEDLRRLRTAGSDVEFTFIKMWQPKGGTDYTARLLRWNDPADREEEQIVIETKEDDSAEITKLGWVLGVVSALGFSIGFLLNDWLRGLETGLLLGSLYSLPKLILDIRARKRQG